MCGRWLLRQFLLWRVPDYIIIIALAIIAAIIGAKVRPHCRIFEWSDPSINYPFTASETFPMYAVAIAVVFVALLYVAGELLTRWSRWAGKQNMCLHVNGWVVTHAFSILLAFAIVNVSKVYAGRLRPDFLARLNKDGITETTAASMSKADLCKAAREGRLSFPSGHAGTAFSGFVPPALYLMGLFRALRGGRIWRVTLALLLLILPIAIAVSRTGDYRHNFDDILAGSVVGAACGVFSVVVNFRPSMRGEWTLRDHADDLAHTRRWMQAVLSGEEMELHSTMTESDAEVEEGVMAQNVRQEGRRMGAAKGASVNEAAVSAHQQPSRE